MAERSELAEHAAIRALEDLEPGLVIAGTYRLLERLGTGGMADVYEAEHERLGNRVALKVLRTGGRADRPGIERFRHEARRVAALSSEHVVKVFDCGELPNGTPYLVMERLWGEDLKSLLEREKQLPIRRAVELAIGACRGLAIVHASGLVHRDLKPANLFVGRGANGADWCKILDFGVAKALVSDATASGALLGTVRYMAPEQLEDAASARATADIYALGAILYESIAGTAPHHGETLQELMFDIVHRDAVPLTELRPVPQELADVVHKALSRDKTKRFQKAEQMAAALAPFGAVAPVQRVVEGVDDATLAEAPDKAVARTRRASTGNRKTWLAAGGGFALGALAIAFGNARPEPAPEAAKARPAMAPSIDGVAPTPTTANEPPARAVPSAAVVESATPPVEPKSRPRVGGAGQKRAKTSADATAAAPGRFDFKDPYSD